MKFLLVTFLLAQLFSQDVEGVLISYNKRIKPIQTFHNEAMQVIYGRSSTKLNGVKRSASETVKYLFEESQNFQQENVFVVDHHEFKRFIGLDPSQKYFAYENLIENEKLNTLIRQAIDKSIAKEKINVIEDAALQVNHQLRLFKDVLNILSYAVIPSDDEWKTIYEAIKRGEAFNYQDGYTTLLSEIYTYQENVLTNELKTAREYELIYNRVQPFKYAWILLLMSTILMGIYQSKVSLLLKRSASYCFAVSFLLIVYGFTLRVMISGRAPVTNMYESILWVGFAACVLVGAKFLSRKDNQTKLIPYALGAATLSIMAADLLPTVFDASISPLQPVLRSTFWLTVHVLIITFSYGAFAVSFIISFIAIIKYLLNKKYIPQIEKANYSALKVGTLTLALGTLTGAIWADFAWGRFWGWDPKETWAAITLLVYMIILHGRFAGWVKKELNYVYSIFGFVSVLMAWYGVNYILGVGLHSYGFSKAGNSWFFYLSGILTLLNVFAITKFQRENNTKRMKESLQKQHVIE